MRTVLGQFAGSAGRPAAEDFLSMRASAGILLASAVVLHTTLIGRPWLFSRGSVRIEGDRGDLQDFQRKWGFVRDRLGQSVGVKRYSESDETLDRVEGKQDCRLVDGRG